MEGVKSYEQLKGAKETEISAGTDQIAQKSEELAASDEKCAVDKQDLVDTTATLKADRDFLANLKMTCQQVDAQMEERQKTRALEIEAVSKALAILSSDEAHDTFTNTFNPAFIQTGKVSSQRVKAAEMIATAAKKAHNPKLALLA